MFFKLKHLTQNFSKIKSCIQCYIYDVIKSRLTLFPLMLRFIKTSNIMAIYYLTNVLTHCVYASINLI